MPYSIERREDTLTVMVTDPEVSDVPRGLAEILRCLDEGGISLVLVGFDEAAWRTGWAENVLTAFETTMGDLGITVQVIGEDARLDPSRRGSTVGSSIEKGTTVEFGLPYEVETAPSDTDDDRSSRLRVLAAAKLRTEFSREGRDPLRGDASDVGDERSDGLLLRRGSSGSRVE